MRRVLDLALAAALCAAGLVETWLPLGTSLGHGSRPLASAACVLAAAGVAVRRRRPVAAAFAVALPVPVFAAFSPLPLLFFGGLLPILVVVYTLAATAPRWVAVPALAIALIQVEIPEFHRAGEIVFDWLCLAAAVAVGRAVGAREAKVEATESRAVGLERAAVAEERARIARELHDVIAHAVSVVVVQAGAAEPLVDEDPERAREALRTIRASGAEVLNEMRRMLGILREPGDELALAPQPSVAQLEPLLEQARATGLDARLAVEGAVRPLPAGLDLAAYRVVQEALTNARKHAAARSVAVRLRYGTDELELEVLDDGRGPNGSTAGGHGLIGMRERVALYGGSLETGPAPAGGFRVHATLPVP